MNKKLVALGVASAFALPLAAQAQTANVTLYGRANVDVEWISGKTCASPTAQGNSGTVSGEQRSQGNVLLTALSLTPSLAALRFDSSTMSGLYSMPSALAPRLAAVITVRPSPDPKSIT